MNAAHDLILLGGALGLLSIFAGLASARIGAPLLLVFLVLGMLAGEDGPGGIAFDDVGAAYFIGSIALAVILFEGGLSVERKMLRAALWPSLLLATVGVALTTAIVAGAAVWLFGAPWIDAMLIGAVVAPTDAAAVSVLLRRAKLALPDRLAAALEIESGFNDPMSVFLAMLATAMLMAPGTMDAQHAGLMFVEEMGGGTAIGIGAGYALLWLLRRISAEVSLFPVLALAASLVVFGGAQRLGASGFLAVYLMGVVVGTHDHHASLAVERFFQTLGWLAQIVLFLMLGLLVDPHALLPLIGPAIALAAALTFVARPVATFACLLPFRFTLRESAFASWVGLKGGVPIYLATIPLLAGVTSASLFFDVAFVIVIVSLAVQGWTIAPVARWLGFGRHT